jgi:hypothetical protein
MIHHTGRLQRWWQLTKPSYLSRAPIVPMQPIRQVCEKVQLGELVSFV